MSRPAGWVAAIALLGCADALAAAPPSAAARTPILSTPHFAIYSDVETNLNDALIAAGLARKRKEAELFRAGDEAGCFAKRPAAERAGWDAAVDYYRQVVSAVSWSDREQFLIRMQLAGFDDEIKTDDDRRFVEIAAGLRAAARPAYAACRWAAQDERNRIWIAALAPKLARDEQGVASRLESLYEKKWNRLPIPVDVVEVVNFAGANSTIDPPHLLVSVENEGSSGFEVIFHEASHVLMARTDPVPRALQAAAGGSPLPPDAWHVVLFYLTGEVVRGALAAAGERDYRPMLYGIFERGTWTEYRAPLESAWPPYLDGKTTLDQAARAFASALPRAPVKPPSN